MTDTTSPDFEALLEAHRRLRAAAEAIVGAASYDAGDGEARVYAYQLQDLKRELQGVPQPTSRTHWMSPT